MNYETQIALSLVANILSQNTDDTEYKDDVDIINLSLSAGIDRPNWKYITLNYREMYEDIIESGLFNNVSNGLTDSIIDRENKKYADVFINFALFREFYMNYFRCGYKHLFYGKIRDYNYSDDEFDKNYDDEFDFRPTPILEKKLFCRSILNKKNRQSIITFIKNVILQLIPDNENFNNKAKLLEILYEQKERVTEFNSKIRMNETNKVNNKIRFVEECNESSLIQIRKNKEEKIRKIRFLYGIVKNVIHVRNIELKRELAQHKEELLIKRLLLSPEKYEEMFHTSPSIRRKKYDSVTIQHFRDIYGIETHIKDVEENLTKNNNFVIPDGYYTYNVDYAFPVIHDNILLQVFIPDFITHIGIDSFRDHLLTELTLPKSLQTIYQFAFSHNQLTKVIFSGNNYVQISDYAFAFNKLTHVTIPVYLQNPLAFDEFVIITVKENELGEYGKKRKSRKNKRKSRKNKIMIINK
jgi:hypothetical protein